MSGVLTVEAADLLAEARRIPGVAGDASVRPDWSPVALRIRKEATDYWNDKVAVDRFEGKGGHFVRGAGRIDGPGRASVNGTTFQASRAIVVATGTAPSIPPIPGLADVPYWTNRQAIEVEDLPASLLILGGGSIGLELAQVFSRFGVKVIVVEVLGRLLAMEEPEAGEELSRIFAREGTEMHLGAQVKSVEKRGDRIALNLDGGARVEGDRLLVATGRRANLAGLGLETVGIDPAQHAIPVDAHLRAGPGLWAVGDVTGKGAFTHIAMYQAGIAVADILGKASAGADYKALPRVTFTDPEVGAAGLTEDEARKKGFRVGTGRAAVPSSAPGGSMARATRGSSSWSRTRTGACWSALRRWAPAAETCSPCSVSPSTPRCRLNACDI